MEDNYLLPRGVKAHLFPQGERIRSFEGSARAIFHKYGYEEVVMPHLDSLSLFARNIGEATDLVEKQIMKIEEKQNLCLRPEATAQIARSYVEEGFYKSRPLFKAFYIGSMFRGERPQKGRLREFRHLGAEFIGSDSAFADAEVISLAYEIVELFTSDFKLEINSLGCENDKSSLVAMLKEKLKPQQEILCPNCRRRYHNNPLRILDCKNSACKDVVSSLNIAHSYLCDNCRSHFQKVLGLLRDFGIEYYLNYNLVRGLDYYNRTVFEFTSSQLGSQSAICAGGRYDNLIGYISGLSHPAVGFALGLERALLLKPEENFSLKLDVFLAYTGEGIKPAAFGILRKLRRANLKCDMDFRSSSLKAQLKMAARRQARFTVIVGEEEYKNNEVVLRQMEKAEQRKVKLDCLIKEIENAAQS